MPTPYAGEHHLLFVRVAMTYRGVSMTELARRIDVPYRTVQDYLRGKSRMPARIVGLIAQALDVSADFLLQGSPRIDQDVAHQCLQMMAHITESGGTIDRPGELFVRLYRENYNPRLSDHDRQKWFDLLKADIKHQGA